MRRVAFVFAALCALLYMPASAGIIYDNGAPDLNVGPWSDFDANIIVADDFVLQQGAETIIDIHWWGYYSGNNTPETDDFLIAIFLDDGGKPAAAPSYVAPSVDPVRIDTGLDVTADPGDTFNLYQYAVSWHPLTLSAGTTYWLSIINNTSDDANDNWAWAPSAQEGLSGWGTFGDGDVIWRTYEQEHAFYLTNDPLVPEPASLTLLGLGAVALAFRMRRKISS